MTILEKLVATDKQLSDKMASWADKHFKLVSFIALSGNAQPWFVVSVLLLIFNVFMSREQNLIQMSAIGVTAIITFIIKHVVKRERPCKDIPLKYVGKGDYWSFPSGHSGRMGAFMTIMSLFFPYLSWLFIIWGLMVCYTRIALRVHYFFDVIGGVIVGLIVAIISFVFTPQLSELYQPIVLFLDQILPF